MKCMRVKYNDWDGKKQERKCFFHLNDLERTRLDAKYTKGEETLEDYVKRITLEGNKAKILGLLEDVILTAYGVRAEDGQGFIKTKTNREEFENSFAYAELFKQLVEKPEDFDAFIKAVMEPISDKAAV